MSVLLAFLVALAAALPTTLVVLGLWVAQARLVDGSSADSVFLSFVFLFVTLIFFVSVASNLVAVAVGELVALADPALGTTATIAAAGVLVWLACGWSQGGVTRLFGGPAPVSAVPVALFSVADMLILAGGLQLLPRPLGS